MDEFLLWDPVEYLGETGTILGLFKSVAMSGVHRQAGQQQQRQGKEEEEGEGGGEQGSETMTDSAAVAPLFPPSSFFALPTFPSLADVEIIDDTSMMMLDDRRHNGIRRGEDRSSPNIVNALEAVTF